MDAAELIHQFAQRSGATQLRLNERGTARLRFDDGLVVDLQSQADGCELLVMTLVDARGGDFAADALGAALRANYLFAATAGAALSLDPHTGELLLSRLVDARETGIESFMRMLEAFVRAVPAVKRLLLDREPPDAPRRAGAAATTFDVLSLRV